MCSDGGWQGFIDKVIENEASDIHVTVGQRPYMRCQGILSAMDTDLSWTYAGRRFRVNAYCQQGFPALAIRLLPERIPSLAELGAPKAWQKLKEVDHGLILVTGRTGSGKTTILAAFLEELNREKAYHIVTLEERGIPRLIQM